jgi:hypothetical protein
MDSKSWSLNSQQEVDGYVYYPMKNPKRDYVHKGTLQVVECREEGSLEEGKKGNQNLIM